MENTTNLGERIKLVRERLDLSQKAFGARIGMSQTAVTALENNQNEPRLSTFNQIVEVYKINPEWLRTGIGEMKGEPSTSQTAPTPGLTSGPATVAEAENVLLRQMNEDLRGMVATLKEELGKFGGNLEAALFGPRPTVPTGAVAVLAH